jgi:hypothetical protein
MNLDDFGTNKTYNGKLAITNTPPDMTENRSDDIDDNVYKYTQWSEIKRDHL